MTIKESNFQHVHPPISVENMSQDAPQRAENNFEHVVIVPEYVGQPLNALDDNE